MSPYTRSLSIGQRVSDELDERMTDEFMRSTRDQMHVPREHERRHQQQAQPQPQQSQHAKPLKPDDLDGLRKMSDTDELVLPMPALHASKSGGPFNSPQPSQLSVSSSSPSALLLSNSVGSPTDSSPLHNGLSDSKSFSFSSAGDMKHSSRATAASNSAAGSGSDEQASKRQRASLRGINRVKLPPLRTTSEPITIRRTTGLDIGQFVSQQSLLTLWLLCARRHAVQSDVLRAALVDGQGRGQDQRVHQSQRDLWHIRRSRSGAYLFCLAFAPS